jgi:Flp pilus assembly protein TadG
MVEFAFVLVPVLLLIVGIIQFGLLFGANVTLNNAVREGARAGTIYVYDRSISTDPRYKNDAKRCGAIVTAATQAFGILSPTAPYFSAPLTSGQCPVPTSDIGVNGDVTVSYCDHANTPDAPCPDTTDPDTACPLDTREGCLIRVTITYRSDIIVPFIGPLIGTDADGRFVQRVSATMVVN